jgi:hypothetical protein
LTVSQCANAVQVLLERKSEGIMTRSQLRLLAERLADDIRRTQERNRRARQSAIRRRVIELQKLDIDCSKVPSCDDS